MIKKIKFKIKNFINYLSTPQNERVVAPVQCRSIFGSNFGNSHQNHLRRTLIELDSDPNIDYKRTSLHNFLTFFQPSSVCNSLGHNYKELGFFEYPWGFFQKNSSKVNIKDIRKSRFCGPSDNSFIKKEFKDFKKLYSAFKKKGINLMSILTLLSKAVGLCHPQATIVL